MKYADIQSLLFWYEANKRDLPWRNTQDPYCIWLSEIILQQTRVDQGLAYYYKFVEAFPRVQDLAKAHVDEVLAMWQGLGYYSRGRNLHATALQVSEIGGFPPTYESQLKLKGVGPYTAAAIAAIAFGRRAVVVDGNVERVITRLYAVETPLPAAKPEIGALMDALTPDVRAGDFAQAMMDLGATVCTPRNPACILCPVAEACNGRTAAERYPVKRAKPVKPERSGVAWWIEREGAVLLVRRPDKGLLGGMRALPGCDWRGTGVAPASGADLETLGQVTHVFTHFRLTLDVARLTSAPDIEAMTEAIWWPIDRLHEAGLPTVFAKAAKLAMSRRDA